MTVKEKHIYKEMSEVDLDNELINLCYYKNDIETISYLVTTKEMLNSPTQDGIDNCLSYAAKKGNIELVRFLLTSSELENKANIHTSFDLPLIWACQEGHLEIVKYLLTSIELEDHANIYAKESTGFLTACEQGKLDVVCFLLTSPDLKNKIDIVVREGGLVNAYYQEKMEVVYFLLNSPLLLKRGSVERVNYDVLEMACGNNDLSFVNYLLTSNETKDNFKNSSLNAKLLRENATKGREDIFKKLMNVAIKNDIDNEVIKDIFQELNKKYPVGKEIIDYLIFDYNVSKDVFLSLGINNDYFKKCFDKRDFMLKIEKELNLKIEINIPKIKL